MPDDTDADNKAAQLYVLSWPLAKSVKSQKYVPSINANGPYTEL